MQVDTLSVRPRATSDKLQAQAVVFEGNARAEVRPLHLKPATPDDIVVDVFWSGVSTGTERMLWSGEMPPFPGMGYPLVPGYESVGRVVDARNHSDLNGQMVFVPGAHCFEGASGLFGASASKLVVSSQRVTPLGVDAGPHLTLLALAATAHHAIQIGGCPDLIVGHGVLGRLTARLAMALGGAIPTVWETNPVRRSGATYPVLAPEDDGCKQYASIMDLSGDVRALDNMIAHAGRGAVITLAGFYKDRPNFSFPPAFMKEITLRIAAEWTPDDLIAVKRLLADGELSFDGLITHTYPAQDVEDAYATAFDEPACLKMIIDWRNDQ